MHDSSRRGPRRRLLGGTAAVRRFAPAIFLLLAACATAESLELGPPQDHSRLFVSPHGEPFRRLPTGPSPIAVWFAGADADRDGAVTSAELRADGDRWFAVLAGADGVIDGFEVAAYEAERVPEILPDGGRRRPERPTPEGSDIVRLPDVQVSRDRLPRRGSGGFNLNGAAPFGITGEPHPIMAADFDQSRRIDQAEFRRASNERFRLLDKGGDGRLTLAELEAIELPRRQAIRRPRGR